MFSGSEWGRVGEQCVKWVLISLGQQALMGVLMPIGVSIGLLVQKCIRVCEKLI